MLGFAVAGMWAYANADHLGVLDDPVVSQAADDACTSLAAQVDAAKVPSGSPPSEFARAIRAQDAAAQGLIRAMEGLGHDRLAGDHPALYWLDDWRTLIQLREKYAQDLGAGLHPHLKLPTVDGIPISRRMPEVADCQVVQSLTHLP
ncbi:hypothetical protein OO014_16725 [Intrasporangium calvum]|uniref:Uncharacterized protein n=1 Tax=Intrasporangium calvum TaxID=53358 RepID=A0ABT5GLG4_9MICO|nr:hypothetical protein [Intrasporangium calvum]MDC5698898.1 hypothetical protein [Intrasporangium calvum]